MNVLKVFIILVAILFNAGVCKSAEITSILPYLYTQEKSNWCWAAVAKSLVRYYGYSPRQCDLVDTAFGYSGAGSSCITGYDGGYYEDSPFNRGLSTSNIQKVLARWEVSSTVTGTYLPQSDCVTEITSQSPFIIAKLWGTPGNSMGGHALLAYGYDGTLLKYWDPALPEKGGGQHVDSYTSVVSNPTAPVPYFWGNTVKNIRKSTGATTWYVADIIPPVGGIEGYATIGGYVNIQSPNDLFTEIDYGTTASYEKGTLYFASYIEPSQQRPAWTGHEYIMIPTSGANTTYHFRTQTKISAVSIINTSGDQTFSVPSSYPTYSITASAGSNGSISPTSAKVNYGASQTFTMTPATGYHVANVVVDGVSKGAMSSYTFSNVSTIHTIAVTFAINTFAITASAGSNGSISPASATVNYGASQTFTISPATGYHIADVLVDGVSKGAVSSYTFPNVTAAHTIFATFTTVSMPGDCDSDNMVSISEVQSAINMFLGIKPVAGCVDISSDGIVAINEVQKTINSFLGIPAAPTTMMQTALSTTIAKSPNIKQATTATAVAEVASMSMAASSVNLNLGVASGTPGSKVTIPLTLTNSTGTNVVSLQTDINYNPAILENPTASLGPVGIDADKYTLRAYSAGVFRIGVVGYNDYPLADGVVVNVSFTIKSTATPGSVALINIPAVSDRFGELMPVTGSNGVINVVLP